MTKKQTPMQKQYYELKEQNQGSILLFRLGDFYEMFDDDAKVASKILGITLTCRHKNSDNEMPMCGIPFHASESYINKLTLAGKKVAICEQVSDASLPGIVKREVVQVITPGTVLSSSVLDPKTSNYIASVIELNGMFGFSYTDITTANFSVMTFDNFELLKNEIKKLNISELLLEEGSSLNSELIDSTKNISHFHVPHNPQKVLCDFFQLKNLKVFYIDEDPEIINSAAFLLSYLLDTQKGNIKHIQNIKKVTNSSYLSIDNASLRNLEVFQTLYNGQYKGSLLSVIDKTVTAGGGRKLKNWLINPLKNIQEINHRLEKVEKYTKNHRKRLELRKLLESTRDIERLICKIATKRANPKDLAALRDTLKLIPNIKKLVEEII